MAANRRNFLFSRLVRRVVLALAALIMAAVPLWGAERISQAQATSNVVRKHPFEVPAIARQLKLFGTVEVDVTIDEEGAVEKAEVLKGNPVLGKAAQDALKNWKFKPFKQDDKAIKVIVTFTCDFK